MKNKYQFDNRKYVLGGIICAVFLLYVGQLFLLQVANSDYKTFADSNAFFKKIIYPSRGLIYDRNGKLIVYNQPTYDIMVVMREINDLDTLDFCRTIGIDKQRFIDRMAEIKDRNKNPGYSSYTPQLFYTQLTPQEYGVLQEKLYRYSGFSIRSRSQRDYDRHAGALLLGYVGEVSKKGLEEDDYYVQGDYTGITGIEKSYEKHLRGEKGCEILLRDAHGRIMASYENGIHDVAPVFGKNLDLSIDIELQEYGELLMQNKVGSIVAIEPSTGEILAMVSSPSYDPAMLVGKQRGTNHKALEQDPYKPLFSRPLMATYPPGSTFKTAQALTYLQEGAIRPESSFPCYHGYPPLGGRPACHSHGSPLALVPAIATSCNAYFCFGLRNLLDDRSIYPTIHEAFDVWKDHMVDMGFGYPLGVDLPNEKRGLIPNSKFYSKRYGENGWRAHTIISIAIGQGEILVTPVQLANLCATIANRGHYYVPHVVRKIQHDELDSIYTHAHHVGIDKKHYETIVEGMERAVLGGTARGTQLDGIAVCGKTGTAENPHGRDHSIFMSFAPKDDPKIAIAVIVENAGFGATFAVPISSLIMEKYLTGKISDRRKYVEDRILNTKILPTNVKNK
ncbi:MAG: penicillin-binding protein 2 [Candidatus Azobacteroides sp.]|nr:penicillin-binding protein 2 [Candidatus Azobacteroides sp.]